MNGYAHVFEAAPDCVTAEAPLAPYLSYKVGGPADVLAQPETVDQLGRVLRGAHLDGAPVFLLGAGTNVLVRDGGVRGVVIHLGRGFRGVRVEENHLYAGASATMTTVAARAEEASLAGLEFGFDIPGSVGGAAIVNAGAHGTEIRDVLAWVEGVDSSGRSLRVEAGEIRFAYRKAIYPLEIVVTEVVFKLSEGDPGVLKSKREAYRAKRLVSQPKGKSVGSIFMNPEGDHAGRLIEASGLKGHRIGGAVVSEKHANFILNENQASARDIEELILEVRRRVLDRFGIELEPEVKIVGEEASLELDGGRPAAPKG